MDRSVLVKLVLFWRVTAAAISYAVFGVGALLLTVVLFPLLFVLPLNRQKKQAWTRRSISFAMWLCVRLMRGLGLLRFRYHNLESLNCSGQLVIANHPGLLDVAFLLSVIPDANCIVKAAMCKNWLTRTMVDLAGYLPNDDEKLLDSVIDVLKRGENLIIFPEGTRTSPYRDFGFQRGAANIAVRARCPVTPIVIICDPPALRKGDKWYDMCDCVVQFDFIVLPGLPVSECVDISRPPSIQARHLTRYLEDLYRRHLPESELTTIYEKTVNENQETIGEKWKVEKKKFTIGS